MQEQIEPIADECRAEVLVTNELGLHARPAALLAQTAQRFSSRLSFSASGRQADAKSILDILSLAATKGTTLLLHGQGPDAREAVEALAALVRRQFREEGP